MAPWGQPGLAAVPDERRSVSGIPAHGAGTHRCGRGSGRAVAPVPPERRQPDDEVDPLELSRHQRRERQPQRLGEVVGRLLRPRPARRGKLGPAPPVHPALPGPAAAHRHRCERLQHRLEPGVGPVEGPRLSVPSHRQTRWMRPRRPSRADAVSKYNKLGQQQRAVRSVRRWGQGRGVKRRECYFEVQPMKSWMSCVIEANRRSKLDTTLPGSACTKVMVAASVVRPTVPATLAIATATADSK